MPDRILLPLIVACALFMENLNSTVLSTALPAIAEDFGANPIHLKLALTSYLLSIAVFIPASGWLADRFGARAIFRLAIATFTIGSILCGLTSTIGEMVVARVIQGIGGAMMMPVGRMVILRSVSKAELVGSLAWLTIPALVGPLLGPPLGGFITTYFEWRWIFWINIPVGVLGLVLATLYIPDIRGLHGRFDGPGFLLSGLGLALFMAGSTTFGLGLVPAPLVLAAIAAGAGMLLGYVVYSRRVANPIIDLSIFRIRTFAVSIIGSLLFRVGLGATPFLLPLLLQVGFDLSPFQSGMTTFSAAIGAIAMKVVALPILRRFGFRSVLIANAVIAGGFVMIPATFSPATPIALIVGILLVSGFFRSLQFTAINALAFADVPDKQISRATTLTSVTQQISLAVGISVGAMCVELTTAATGGAITAASFWPAFVVVGLLAMLAAIPFARLDRSAGQEMSGHRRIAPDAVSAMRDRG